MDKITYKPHRIHMVFSYVMFVLSLFFIVVSFMAWTDSQGNEGILLSLFGALTIVLTIYLHVTSKVMIVFEECGIRILNTLNAKERFIPWEKSCYGYFQRSYRGFEFLILSTDKLSKAQAKKLANKGDESSKVYIDNAIVIYLDSMQDTAKIKEIVEENLSRLHGECIKTYS